MDDQREVKDREVEDVNLWKVVAGAAVHHLPIQGSPVYYLPNQHLAAASSTDSADSLAGNLPRKVPAVVTSFELRARGEDPYVRYQLRVGDEGAGDEILLPRGLDSGVLFYTKQLTATDVKYVKDQTAYCSIMPKDMPENLLPAAPSLSQLSTAKSLNQPIDLTGMQGNHFKLTCISRRTRGKIRHYLGGEWHAFKNQNQLMEGDRIAFTRGPAADGPLKFGVRRITEGGKAAPPASARFEIGQVLTVDYFPGRSVGDEYVVLRTAMDRAWGELKEDTEVICNLGESENGAIMELHKTLIKSRELDDSCLCFTIWGIDDFHCGVRPWNLRIPGEDSDDDDEQESKSDGDDE